MLTLIKVAVTGLPASGKSSVCQLLKERGAFVVNADELAHSLLVPSTPIGRKVVELLGPSVLQGEQLDRGEIAKLVFKEPILLQKLEALLHPAIWELLQQAYRKASAAGTYSLFVAEVPLLFEVGWDSWFDQVIAVFATPELCRQRFQACHAGQESGQENLWNERVSRLWPRETIRQKAHFVIENSGNWDHLKEQVARVAQQLFQAKPI